MNIVILSGGSGNDVLMHGLIDNNHFNDIKVITNAYDNGKSTGVCRLITNTLGVSDIRKNHFRMYKYTDGFKEDAIISFYTERFNMGDNPCEFCLNKLNEWGLDFFSKYIKDFFKRPLAKEFKYNDFNIANIVYAEMYSKKGYNDTNKFFAKFLRINDFVILNSFDNIYIDAITENNQLVKGEERIVDYKNSKDPICKIRYSTDYYFKNLNEDSIKAIEEADVIIISTGTFWSSIYPTLEYGDFYKYINNSNAKKIWVMNTEEDKDAYGVTSNKFIKILEKLGLDLSKFIILENKDAVSSLQEKNSKYNIKYEHLGNHEGRNDLIKYSKVIEDLINE